MIPQTLTVTRIVQTHLVRRTPRDTWEHLLMRRAPTERIFPDMWQVITGSIEEGEMPIQTAFREISEETGITVEMLWVIPHVGMFYDVPRNEMNLVPCFAAILNNADTYAQVIVNLSDEHTDYEWLECNAALQRLVIPSHIQGVETLERHILPLLQRGDEPVFAKFVRKEVVL
jgi:dihydroneopterin triphosphate diphosphatase